MCADFVLIIMHLCFYQSLPWYVSLHLQCCVMFSAVFEVKHCYYKWKGLIDIFLYSVVDKSVLSNFLFHGLVFDSDYSIITSVPCGWQRNWLLLQHIMHLVPLALLTFWQLLQRNQLELFQKLFKGT